nr:nickel pincer cofactor biosynthesis protein LarC [Pseudanabaena sp. FACHB-1998]
MANIAYLDCPTGIAGDMCLGALVSAGVPLEYLQDIVRKLGLESEVKLWTELVIRGSLEATKLHVELLNHTGDEPPTVAAKHSHEVHSHHHEHSHGEHAHESHSHEHNHDSHEQNPHAPHRHLPEIEKLIREAKLAPQIEARSLAIFRQLAIAEGAVHGIAPEAVHFHEVGAIDAIVDIVCTCAGFAWLEVKKIYCSALPVGGGYVDCDHGKMPVPAPATLKLWEMHNVTICDNGIRKELVTPTGAAIAVTLSEKFGEVPLMKIKKIGLGAGSQDLEIPNALRLWIGKSKKKKA